MFGGLFVIAAIALPGAYEQPQIQVVTPDRSAARAVSIIGASESEVAAARSALARLGSDGPIRSVAFGRQRDGRRIAAVYTSKDEGLRSFWLTQLFLDDVGTRAR